MKRFYEAPGIPWEFFWRRMHSFTGFWLALFLVEHLLTNSQAALFVGDDGAGFIHGVNWIKSLPYLPVIEITLLGVPILIHMMWGIAYLRSGELSTFPTDGTKPALGRYARNQAYSWQRITSWVLVFTLVGHIVQMRFLDYPSSAKRGTDHDYMVRLDEDRGLSTLSKRLGFRIMDSEAIQEQKATLASIAPSDPIAKQDWEQKQAWIAVLEERTLQAGQVVAVAPDFGTAELLMVRETFKMPIMLVLYTIFVLAACYHGYNGLWTFCITWGITLSATSQRLMRRFSVAMIILISFLGLAAVWGTYWVNLKS